MNSKSIQQKPWEEEWENKFQKITGNKSCGTPVGSMCGFGCATIRKNIYSIISELLEEDCGEKPYSKPKPWENKFDKEFGEYPFLKGKHNYYGTDIGKDIKQFISQLLDEASAMRTGLLNGQLKIGIKLGRQEGRQSLKKELIEKFEKVNFDCGCIHCEGNCGRYEGRGETDRIEREVKHILEDIN